MHYKITYKMNAKREDEVCRCSPAARSLGLESALGSWAEKVLMLTVVKDTLGRLG